MPKVARPAARALPGNLAVFPFFCNTTSRQTETSEAHGPVRPWHAPTTVGHIRRMLEKLVPPSTATPIADYL